MFKKFVFIAIAALSAATASAGETFPEIKPRDAEYAYYRKAIDLDKEFISQGLVDPFFYPYSSDLFLKSLPNSTRIYGRIVQLIDGPKLNPRNLVISVGESLFYVHVDLNKTDSRISMARRWKDNNGEPPGIYLVIRGWRAGALRGELIPLTIDIRISDTAGHRLAAVEYYEDRAW